MCGKTILAIAWAGLAFSAHAQNDTIKEVNLQEVVVKAFEQNRKLKDVPAAVNYIGRQALERFSAASVVAAVNTTPGVRLEERSPGSYRFNIRGSSLRSPFGVRNVKIYYNDLPLTDPGGHTYFNSLGYYNFGSMEIIKGPGSSLYGAGTGGVLLIESLDENARPGVFAEYATGSYGLQNVYASVTTRKENSINRFGSQYQENKGYRNQSALKRNIHSWNGLFRFGNGRELKTTFLYSNLYYGTPGALTLQEFSADPKMARPAAGFFPGAEQAGASIRQKTFIAGASYVQPLLPGLQNKSTVYGAFTELRNPNVRAYDRSSEPHVGGRTIFTFQKPVNRSTVTLLAGSELQSGYTIANSFKNVNGAADSLRYFDDIRNRNFFVFAQGSFELENWLLEAGGSWNLLRIKFQRFIPRALGEQTRRFDNQLAPRVSLSKKFSNITVYSSVARGFSPPTTAELLPTGGGINLNLNAEYGTNYDLGARGTLVNGLYADVNAFVFSLNRTIVQRRDAGGGDFFVNAGSTRQYGTETYISYPLLQSAAFMKKSLMWISHTWHHFRYRDFKQLTTDFSGNRLPAVAPHTVAAGFDFTANNGLLGALTYYYSDPLPLNDANTAYANGYHLLGAKLGFEKWIRNVIRIKLLTGVDNLLDQRYSLGNDINGFGGRFYNAAPGRNYYAGIIFQWAGK